MNGFVFRMDADQVSRFVAEEVARRGRGVSTLARQNGWRGFDTAGAVKRVDGGYEYSCDGMPTMMGCWSYVVIPRRWSHVGLKKKSGWYVCYGLNDDGSHDEDVVLVYCPSCAVVVRDQESASPGGPNDG